MSAPFSNLELQLVRSSLAIRTNEEIAFLLERPVEDVLNIINELTEGGANERTNDVLQYKQEKEKKKVKPVSKVKLEKKELAKVKEERESKKRQEVESQWEQQRNYARKREERRTYKTRPLDLENKISVRLDDKTFAFITRQSTDKETNALIEMTRFNYLQSKRKRLLEKD